MSLAELAPSLHGLTRADKLRVIQMLATDIAQEEVGETMIGDGVHPILSPYDSFEGAATLLHLLELPEEQ